MPVLKRFDEVFERFEVAWKDGVPPALPDYLMDFEGEMRSQLLRQLLDIDVGYRIQNGQSPTCEFYQQMLPEDTSLIQEEFRKKGWDDSLRQTVDEDAGTDDRPNEKQKPYHLPKSIDRFRVKKKLGSGGFGLVCLCRDPNLEEDVAVKIPRPDREFYEREVNEFLKEAGRASKLREHPNIVRVREAQNRGKDSFIVSDYVDGKNLADWMEEEEFSPEEAVRLIATVADALHHAHRQGFVHRDVKPGNILLDRGGKPYLSDFGMAASEEEQFAEGGGIRGTTSYLSPEQARGESHLAGPTADIFSLGVVLYEMLSGVRPFRGKTKSEIIEKIKSPHPPRSIRLHKPDVPEALEAICMKCLRKNAEERYGNAFDLKSALDEWLQETDYQPVKSAPKRTLRQKLMWTSFTIIAFAFLSFFLVAGIFWAPNWWKGIEGRTGHNAAKKYQKRPREFETSAHTEWVKKLGEPLDVHFPGHKGMGRSWFEKDEPTSLGLAADDIGLVQFGELTERDFRLSINIRLLDWRGQAGLFFGYRTKKRAGEVCAEFQLFRFGTIDQHNTTLIVGRHKAVFLKGTEGIIPDFSAQSRRISLRSKQPHLQIHVENGMLKEFKVDEKDLKSLMATHVNRAFPPSRFQGVWGGFVQEGTAWFIDPNLTIERPK